MTSAAFARFVSYLIALCLGIGMGYVYFGNGSTKPAPTMSAQQFVLNTELATPYSPSVTRIVTDHLFERVKVFCWVLTYPSNHATKAKAVRDTWAPRCNKVVFMSSKVDELIPTIDLKMTGEGRDKLWEKSRKAWYYTYKNFGDDYDWFMKADDDSFVVVENLRYFCSLHDPNEGHYFGRVFKPMGTYQSGGAGYVVSRAALKQVGPLLAEDEKCAKGVWQVEDAKFGACLREVGVPTGNSQDSGKDRFHPFVPEQHLIPGLIPEKFWYRDYVMYPAKEGPECCSDLSISFHYITPNLMRELYFYIYRLHPYGARKEDDLLPAPRFVRPVQEQTVADKKVSAVAASADKDSAQPKDAAAKEGKDDKPATGVKLSNDGKPVEKS
ncbi:glycoprotein-N-acetylgalactosamine 3-beta-galactosyltransferase 1-like [Sycon ciliatum]|uniref:glycoprotein-N-acetylgalactosamine 3-beta-galactosyltransferase 1-like n=1 Tax=Sycon ciliatum TaxID=27933 RepID=UPI0031F67EF2